jgi:hypothetical protein
MYFRSALDGNPTRLLILGLTLLVVVAVVIVIYRLIGPVQHIERDD